VVACGVNYYEHHIGDFAAATSHLTLVEDAIYSRLLRRYYLQECPLPADVTKVARLCGARSADEVDATEAILSEFFMLEADGWHNKRADEEIARFQDKQAKAKASADARWKGHEKTNGKPSVSERNADALPTHSEGNAHQSPDTNTKSEREMPASTPAGDAGKALRSAGCSTLNMKNPDFLAALAEGVTPEEFGAAANEAGDRGISPQARFNYAVKVARSNHAKSASVIDLPNARAGPGRSQSDSRTLQAINTLDQVADHVTRNAANARLDRQRTQDWSEEAAHTQLGGPAVG
jgi:uncharacterized protein YdaU (DUF1376 family)